MYQLRIYEWIGDVYNVVIQIRFSFFPHPFMYGYVFFFAIDALELDFPHIFFLRFCKIVRLINIDLFHINLRNDLVCGVDRIMFAVSPLNLCFFCKKSFIYPRFILLNY